MGGLEIKSIPSRAPSNALCLVDPHRRAVSSVLRCAHSWSPSCSRPASLAGAAHAQTWLTDPAFGARRDAYGPRAHMDATGRAYHDTPSNACVFEPVQPNAYGLGVGSDTLGRPVVPTYGIPHRQ